MTNLAVEERPATQTTSEANEVRSSEGLEPTAPNPEVQQTSEPTSDPEESTDQPDPREQRVQALSDAERLEAEEAGRTKALNELQGNQQAIQREQTRQQLRNTFTSEIQKIDNVFGNARDEYGSPRPLTVTEQNAVKASFNELNKKATDAVAEQVKDVAYSILPAEAADAFTKLTDGEVDLATYLNHWVEVAAPFTKAGKDSIKSLDLDAVMKANTKIKREVEALKLAEYDAGREQGRKDPEGTSPDGGRTTTRSAPGQKSFIELEEGYGSGTLTKAEEKLYKDMREVRKRS